MKIALTGVAKRSFSFSQMLRQQRSKIATLWGRFCCSALLKESLSSFEMARPTEPPCLPLLWLTP